MRGGSVIRRRGLTALDLLLILNTGLLSVGVGSQVYGPSGVATVTEWTIPTPGSFATKMALDPAGSRCWFVQTQTGKIAQFEPASGLFQEWQIPTLNSRPTGLATTRMLGTLAVFGTEFAANKIFVFFPQSRMFREYTLPTPDSGPWQISVEFSGMEVRAWFSELGTAGARNGVGQLVYDPQTGTAELIEWILPEDAGGAANGVYVRSGVAWFAGWNAILKFDTVSNDTTIWPTSFHPSGTLNAFITVDSLNQVWYTARSPGAMAENYVGVLVGDSFREWQLPTVNTDPRVISIDPLTQNPWIAQREETGEEGRIAKLEPATGGIVFSTTPKAITLNPETTSLEPVMQGPVGPKLTSVSPRTRTLTAEVTAEFTEWILGAGSVPQDVIIDAAGDVWILESGTNKIAKLSVADPDYSLRSSAPAISVHQGTSAGISITGASIRGFSGQVMLALRGPTPSGVSFTFAPNPLTVPYTGLNSSTLIVNVASDAPTGPNTVVVLGTSEDRKIRPATFQLLVVRSEPRDFAISLVPSYLNIPRGGVGRSTVTIRSIGEFNATVTLTYASLPGITVQFENNALTLLPNGTASTEMSVMVDANVPSDAESVIITGVSGVLSHSSTLALSIGPPMCIVATAAYGSELSPEVSMLRSFRDNRIESTLAGHSFLLVFNAWYYSFSPQIAAQILGNEAARAIMKALFYPLIGILALSAELFKVASGNPEAAALVSGLFASSMIGIVYVGLPLGLTTVKLHRISTRNVRRLEKLLAVTLLLGLGGLILGELLISVLILGMSTSLLVLSALLLSGIITSAAIGSKLRTEAYHSALLPQSGYASMNSSAPS